MIMKIPIIFLGTGQAIPTAKRNHIAIFIQYKNEHILVDCGEGTQRQFRKAKLNMCKLNRLLITHWHGDHILGIPGLLQTLQLNKFSNVLKIYGPRGTAKCIELMEKLFIKRNNIRIEVHEIERGKVFETHDLIVEALPMTHVANCLAYSISEKDKIRIDKKKLAKLKIKGKIIGELAKGKDIVWNGKKILAKDLTYKEKGRKIAIILDTSPNSNAIKIAENADLLISESTYSQKEMDLAKEYKHLTASQSAEIAKKAKVKRLILTHLSQRYDKQEFEIYNEARRIFKNSALSEDLDKVEI